MPQQGPHTLVLDVGKTNVKAHVLNENQESLAVHNLDNRVINVDPYPHADTSTIWDWMMGVFATVSRGFEVTDIAVTTHGATAALVDLTMGGDGLVLPVMDYEWQGVDPEGEYSGIRPPFSETFSPRLPAGLNLGRQLFWQQSTFPGEFARARAILMYPQYWTWRLTGSAVSEVSSLGCHTDLWAPRQHSYSRLVERQGWTGLFPPRVAAWTVAGTLRKAVSEKTGLPGNCRVRAGVHDSNASLLRFVLAMAGRNFCLVSSGTWVVCMTSGDSVDSLDETRDMLANVSVEEDLIPCVRFMGGREYARICKACGTSSGEAVDPSGVASIVTAHAFALPDFSEGSGPFGGRLPEIRGEVSSGVALATLYCVLMVDYCLDLLGATDDIIIAGSYLQNPLLCALVAQLRMPQPVLLSSDTAGTVRGTAQLTNWRRPVSVSLTRCEPTALHGLEAYRDRWRELAEARS